MSSIQEWIEYVKKVLNQYDEGAILAGEAFNAIVAKAMDVEQVDFCYICGEAKANCKCENRS